MKEIELLAIKIFTPVLITGNLNIPIHVRYSNKCTTNS